jgi:hypothetical protein
VRGWDVDGCTVRSIAAINFDAFPTRYGAPVAGGDVDADGFAEITVATGPAASELPRFRGFDYDGVVVAPLAGFDVLLPVTTMYGGRLGTGDIDGDASTDLITGAGPDPAAASTVRRYGYRGSSLVLVPGSFDPFPVGYGVNVAGAPLGY